MTFEIHHGDCLDGLRGMADNSVDSVVTDPPYGLAFMGKKWDYDVPSVEIWAECLRVLKPGGHLLAFAGTRTQHRMAVRIEDAGFEIRDMIAWVYGSGFPKSLDVSKAIDKDADYRMQSAYRRAYVVAVQEAGLTLPGNSRHDWTVGEHAPGDKWWAEFERWLPGLSDAERERIDRIVVGKGFKPRPTLHTGSIGGVAEANQYDITAPATDAARQWEGWGTALKPALEPITVARKPLTGTVAANVLVHGTGALNVDGCRVPTDENLNGGAYATTRQESTSDWAKSGSLHKSTGEAFVQPSGRWPANLIHDGSDEVLQAFPQASGAVAPVKGTEASAKTANAFGEYSGRAPSDKRDGGGSAARFFYCAKASKKDRDEGCELIEAGQYSHDGRKTPIDNAYQRNSSRSSNTHPTVKPTRLMAYLCRLVTPPGGIVLDPFMGSGSTGKAAMREGFRFIGIEREEAYAVIARARVEAERVKAVSKAPPEIDRQTDLFEEAV